ncbi:M16 family metallopeptidase [Wohlfahrtiimonas larvae]|uniref:Pitrilysin family protein n=1 Tax=Wohlfahrtiimonas larvae TaxID=1157986 RepID=A0ABP9MPE7_9GAMM|nr:pitrilysin family protein [Wohlfahrtiimonas larvae]
MALPTIQSRKGLKQILAATTLSILATTAIAGQDMTTNNTHEFTLDNGLKLIVREDHRAPVAVTMVWYKVGSVDEPRGKGGLSHMLEHMMFKGTPTLKPNEHSTIIANLGGKDNAFTSYDYTAYFEILPSWELETSLRLESDRMANLVLKDEDFTPERQVVAEERRQRTDSNPQSLFYEAFNATVWTTNAYRNPIIGWMPEIQSWTLDDLKSWYKQFYRPNNATVVIVGDVDAKKTHELVNQYFGKIPRGEEIVREINFEVPQNDTKYIEMATPANLPVLFMAYKVPSINSTDNKQEAYALLLASEILSGSNTARLPKKMVRESQKSLDASSYYNEGSRYDTTFMLSAVPADGVELETLEAEIKAEIKNLQTTLVAKEELNKILTAYRTSQIFAKDSLYSQAMSIGSSETTGEGWRNRENLVSYLEKVTPEEIQQVAQKYLNDGNLTVGRLRAHTAPIEAINEGE